MFLLVLPMAFILDFLGALLVGLCAFWLESTQGIALIYSRLMMLLGGSDGAARRLSRLACSRFFGRCRSRQSSMRRDECSWLPVPHCFSNAWHCRLACLVVYGAGAFALHTLRADGACS